MWLKIAKIDLAGRTKKSIGGADSHYIYIYYIFIYMKRIYETFLKLF